MVVLPGDEVVTMPSNDPSAAGAVPSRAAVVVIWRRHFDFTARAIERDLGVRGVDFVRVRTERGVRVTGATGC